MPQGPRGPLPAGFYHVTTRTTFGRTMFRVASDRLRFLIWVGDVCARHEITVLAYCLLTTHYHLLLRIDRADELQAAMHRLNGVYGGWFNREYAEYGRLFARRYTHVPVASHGHLLELFRYIAGNPGRAGLCDLPEEWRWSSYRASLGIDPAPPWLDALWAFSLFGGTADRARERLREFVAAEATVPAA
jgi:putative transposase